MLNLPQVDSKHGVALSGLSKAGEIVLSMAAFLPNEKLSGVIIMNSVMNYFVQDVIYKGEKVLSGKSIINTATGFAYFRSIAIINWLYTYDHFQDTS